ncbi:hypothetical protein GCM10017559_14310 [Streptosporangium longisporum]|uniref:Uncharacterized protein n=1 Tax=Streptosporangium longisporum TaxID=46187 RepID=A0ABN3XVA5_9ACTN
MESPPHRGRTSSGGSRKGGRVGVEVVAEGPAGSFGRQVLREDVTPPLPAGEIPHRPRALSGR